VELQYVIAIACVLVTVLFSAGGLLYYRRLTPSARSLGAADANLSVEERRRRHIAQLDESAKAAAAAAAAARREREAAKAEEEVAQLRGGTRRAFARTPENQAHLPVLTSNAKDEGFKKRIEELEATAKAAAAAATLAKLEAAQQGGRWTPTHDDDDNSVSEAAASPAPTSASNSRSSNNDNTNVRGSAARPAAAPPSAGSPSAGPSSASHANPKPREYGIGSDMQRYKLVKPMPDPEALSARRELAALRLELRWPEPSAEQGGVPIGITATDFRGNHRLTRRFRPTDPVIALMDAVQVSGSFPSCTTVRIA
jgi:hypothetical protein